MPTVIMRIRFSLRSLVIRLSTCTLLLGVTSTVHAQDTAPWTDTVMTVGDQKIHCRVGGSGPHLLLLHGFTLTGEQWMPLAVHFTDDYTVIVADLPGHGGSSPIPVPFRFARAAELLHDALNALGVDTIFAAGHSGGAITLLHMAAQQPERFAGLVIVDGTPYLGKTAQEFIRADRYETWDEATRTYYDSLHPGGWAQLDHILAQYYSLADNEEHIATETLHHLSVPTLLIWGDRDQYFPLEMALEMYNAMPNAALWVVPGQGHTPIWPAFGGSTLAAEKFRPRVIEFFQNAANRD